VSSVNSRNRRCMSNGATIALTVLPLLRTVLLPLPAVLTIMRSVLLFPECTAAAVRMSASCCADPIMKLSS
jgi:hypothetical protein